MTLFLLAAGMGSRYGGLKQLDGLGPNGETIMDYSIYDAIEAGFDKVVWVIRHDFEQQFREQILSKYEKRIACELCFQDLDALPEGFSLPEGRVKPWGTNHAVLMGKDVITDPFCVINCDDFYSRDAFRVMAAFLRSLPAGAKGQYAMVGFPIANTLSENGTVSRGICEKNVEGCLTSCVERTKIARQEDGTIAYRRDNQEDGDWVAVDPAAPVSMNVWGFTPDYFEHSEKAFRAFLSDEANIKNLKSEFYIPMMVNQLIQSGEATCQVLSTTAHWFGVTYAEDRPGTVARLAELAANGTYPTPLW